MSEAPKLFTNKPKKAQLKLVQEQQKAMNSAKPASSVLPSSAAAAAAASYTTGLQSSAPPAPPPPKESFARRYKFLWPLLLAVNLGVGAYLFMRTKKKDTTLTNEEEMNAVPSTPASTAAVTSAPITETPLPSPPVSEPVKVRGPIPVDQQRELFKWILEEKRKIKPRDPEEKKRIDEEKAILKQFIRAKSIPNL